VAAVLLVRLADESATFLPSGTLESFRADLGLTYAQAGTVLAMMAPGALLGGVFAAAADRFSRRVIAAGGAFGFAAALALFAVGDSFAYLALASFAIGLATTAMVDASEVALVDMAGEDLRRFLARSNLVGVAGDLLGPGIITAVALCGLSWRAAFAVGSALMALYGLVLSAAPLPPPDRAGDGTGDGSGRRLAGVLRDPAVWIVGGIALLMGPFDEPLFAFTIALLQEDRGASTAVATAVTMVGLAGGLLSYTVLARRFEGIADHRLLIGSALAMGAAAVVIALVPVVALVALALLLASIGLNLAWLALQHRSLTLRPGQVGTTQAVVDTIEFGGFWIPVAIGALADRAGLPAAVTAFAVLGAAMAALTWWDSRRSRRIRVLPSD
jgi:predicted MFS family arabinose efflux permease